MNKLVKLSVLFLFLSVPSAFAGTTICEFNNPNTGTTLDCWDGIIASYGPGTSGSYTQILEIKKDGEEVVRAYRTFPYYYTNPTFCEMGLSTGQDDYSLTAFNTYDGCTHYRIDTQ